MSALQRGHVAELIITMGTMLATSAASYHWFGSPLNRWLKGRDALSIQNRRRAEMAAVTFDAV